MTDEEKNELLKKVAPLIFCDGTAVFKKFMDENIVHKKGFFILAPSGTGKTYFVKNQKEKHWIDGDMLWEQAFAHPHFSTAWWTKGLEVIMEIDKKSDVITMIAKELGLWLIGASNCWLRPDAIVIPDWEIHKRYIKEREGHYDGGATSDDHSQVLNHIKWIEDAWLKNDPVSKFKSIEEAACFLTSQIK